jgi:protein-tyrosine-phosphatase
MKERKVLFLCYGNLCRSPMAAGFFNALRGGLPIVAESAGMGAVDGSPASLLAVLELKRRGMDISGHRARNIASVNLGAYEEIIALDREVALSLDTAAPRHPKIRVWNIADPYGGSAGEYRDAAEILRTYVEEYVRGLTAAEDR